MFVLSILLSVILFSRRDHRFLSLGGTACENLKDDAMNTTLANVGEGEVAYFIGYFLGLFLVIAFIFGVVKCLQAVCEC